jgi:hypothetical protein
LNNPDPGPDFYPSRIQGKKAPDPGSGSATLETKRNCYLIFGVDIDIVTFEEYPDHLQMTVGDGLVKGRNTVRVRNVHVHIRMREKMQNSLEKGKN